MALLVSSVPLSLTIIAGLSAKLDQAIELAATRVPDSEASPRQPVTPGSGANIEEE
jgi:hypothetical protein